MVRDHRRGPAGRWAKPSRSNSIAKACPTRIRGWAQSVNFIASVSQAGCRFLALEGDGSDRLRDWLVALVIMNASVRISEKDAATIVAGPSLI
jgi:hypothetical protein